MLLNLFALIIVLGVLILLHEGGHFLAARAVGAPVSVFSFGFGKRLFGIRRRGTDFRVSLIPLGGYVRIEGLGPDESDVVGAERSATPLLARWRRALILVAGPLANVLGAIAFLAASYMVGVPVPAWHQEPPVIAWVDPGSPAAAAGLTPGDVVLAVDGRPIATWRQLEQATVAAANRPLKVTFRRDGATREVTLTPRSETRYELGYAGLAPPLPAQVEGVLPGSPAQKAGLAAGDIIVAVDGHPVEHFYHLVKLISERPGRQVTITVQRQSEILSITATTRDEAGRGMLGIPAPNPTVLRQFGAAAAVVEAVRECRRMTRETFNVIGRMLTGRSSLRQMSGPIDIARFSGAAARSGAISLVRLLGVISLQLAIFNLLPIPVLDGGHLAVIGIEAVARRDLPDKLKERILNVGFWLIIALVVVVLFNDVVKNL
ncbi:MAG: RIP metalloprotease RseP [Acidobacteriota bacterium]|jgi:regulator of sigma E protease